MPERATLKPKRLPNGSWQLNVPASLSKTGSRHVREILSLRREDDSAEAEPRI